MDMFTGVKVEDPLPPIPNDKGLDLTQLIAKIDQLIEAFGAMVSSSPEQNHADDQEATGWMRLFGPVYNKGNSVQGPLSVILDTQGRPVVDVWVQSTAVTTFLISGSVDGQNYRLATSISLAQPGEAHVGYSNAYKYIKVETDPSKLNNADNSIEIVATR